LKDITRLPAQHILVILDACHSGLALGSILQSRIRGLAPPAIDPMDKLRARRSRRIITSALEDQVAMDRGPVPGHSLFTGCLIEALTHGLRSATGATLVTGSDIVGLKPRPADYPAVRLLNGPGGNGSAIRNGATYQLKPGDAIIIPAGVGHWFTKVDDHIRYIMIRIDPDKVTPIKNEAGSKADLAGR